MVLYLLCRIQDFKGDFHLDYSYKKSMVLKNTKEKRLSTFLIAVLTASIIFVPYIILSKGYFIFFGDFNVQQIPFYQMCHKMVRQGNFSWNWYTDLGVNFIGSYSFYLLGSPFFWLTIPFPDSFVPYLMGPLLILKFGCCAFTAYLYIRRFTRTPDSARLGALLYAFSGFSVYNIFFNHFHEAIICFPLLLLSMELLITENKRGVFALTVALCSFVNYFFFFGMVVFAVIYFFVRVFSGVIKVKFSRFLVLLFEAVIGVLLSSVLLLPSALAVISNSRLSSVLLGWNAITYGKEQIYLNIIECFFFPPDLPARPVFFPGAEVKWSSLGGWLPVFGMSGVFTLFIHKKGSWLKRLIGICIFMSLIPVLNSSFSAFNSAYYARWFYMPILIMCLSSAQLLEDKSVDFSSGYRWTLGVTLAFALVIGLFPQKNSDGKIIYGLYSQSDDYTYVMRFWVEVLIALVSLLILFLLLKIRKDNRKNFFKVSTVCVVIISVIYSSFFIACGRSHSYDIKATMIEDLIEGDVYLEDDNNFRIDTYDGIDNTGIYLGFQSINAFHSVVPASITEFYKYLGVERTVASRPDEDLPAIRSLLSVKYLLNRTDGESFLDENDEPKIPGFKYKKTSGGYYVYENENYVPYGVSYEYYVTEEYLKNYSGNQRSRMMLKAVLLNENQIKKYKDCLKNLQDIKSFEEDDKTSLSMSNDAMKFDAEKLRNTAAKSFEIDNNGFTAKVSRKSRSLVFFSVPYDKGFTATVNGEPVEIEEVNKGFMAVAVPSGTSTIRFTYNTPGLKLGAYITLASLFVFLVYYLSALVFIKRHPSNTYYPEGELLINKWHKDDIAESEFDFSLDTEEDEYDGIPDIKEIEKAKTIFEADDELSNSGFSVDTDLFDD